MSNIIYKTHLFLQSPQYFFLYQLNFAFVVTSHLYQLLLLFCFYLKVHRDFSVIVICAIQKWFVIIIMYLKLCPVVVLGFYEERALLLGRLGRHEQALAIYAHILKDTKRAEEYCRRNYARDPEANKDVI